MSGHHQNPDEAAFALYKKGLKELEALSVQIEQLKGDIKNLKYRLGVLSDSDVQLGELIRKAEIEEESNRRAARAYEESAKREKRRERQHREKRDVGIFATAVAGFTGLVLAPVSGTYT